MPIRDLLQKQVRTYIGTPCHMSPDPLRSLPDGGGRIEGGGEQRNARRGKELGKVKTSHVLLLLPQPIASFSRPDLAPLSSIRLVSLNFPPLDMQRV